MPPVAVAAGIGVAGTVASTVIGSRAAKKAGKAQARAAESSAAIEARQFEQTRADLAPWRKVGEQALYQYADILGVPRPGGPPPGAPDRSAFFKSPGYEFRLSEGIKAVERSAASRGSLQSGATMKAIQRYGEGLASSEYNSYLGRLAGLAGTGQQVVTQTGVLGAQSAAGQGAAIQNAGAARASGYLGSAGQIQQGISDIAGFGNVLFGEGGPLGKKAPQSGQYERPFAGWR